MTFEQRLYTEYPIPKEASIWGGSATNPPQEDLNLLIESCVDDLASDIQITSYIDAYGMATQMPSDCVGIVAANLKFPFQGNRLVKVTYDKYQNVAYLRYYPATITYKKRFRVCDIDLLSGDQLIFVKSYILYKMADKELYLVKSVDLALESASIQVTPLEKFRDTQYQKYEELKKEIALYSAVF